ncbi:hypothetical protein JNUCC1_03344 [Lentibacillus sp. JNUCC-1]|uniref:phage terminase small subunit P27 family n=1 Tax=Lentibacillus sp. JNUCC-1 TaxID=2654513 RepID=UPI0012E831B4|nr:phage terminase small subunit P27 family [Lentibacillus sp. JNUCC-1]MUV39466.1 hypothetical protein [Lentibacillus sp. JNUCC-1]
MSGRKKQPLAVIQGKGKSNHITKEEAKERQRQEDKLKGSTDKIAPPSYLTKKQKEEFTELATELTELGIFSNLDVDFLARYIDAKTEYVKVAREMRKMKATEKLVIDEHGTKRTFANKDYGSLNRMRNILFADCKSAASELGLSITSRLKLVIPEREGEEDQTPMEKFMKKRGSNA